MDLSKSEEKKYLLDVIGIKKNILSMIHAVQSGHPGGSLSCANLIYLLYTKIMSINQKNPKWEGRDFFILSKGHAAPALYAVLSKIGFIDPKELKTLRQYNSQLQGHPVKNIDIGIEISTGSLGMGLSIGLGCALASKLDQNDRKIYVLLGDGELNEGIIWEAAMAANQYKLDNLIAIVDRNGIQSDGSTEEIMALEPLSDKWRAFGWQVIDVDGSDLNGTINAFKKAKGTIGKPSVIISYQIKGADVSFMENTKKFHGRPPNDEEYQHAINELNKIENDIISGAF
ncbi:MAG: transketolase [Promethearchaeota archaeon]